MLLKSLDIQGFKTFPDKTTLTFDKGITAVVGPNGSGKSNISDAMRWVLGEQSIRTLRCTKMEDVIFNGTPTRKALGFAEVTLTIDNAARRLPLDGDTVAVTRRYYRSGESEYRINRVAVRLRDINELFMDTGLGRDGYSMIGQGKIDSIVAARSEDRREIFEEAAGISRFRYRKAESERRLSQAEENLLRLRDILGELESRVGPLREQSEKAQKFLELSQKKRTLEIGLWLSTLERSGQVLREQDDQILITRRRYEDIQGELDKMDAQIEESFSKSNACAAQADEIRQEAARLEEGAARKEGEISVLENDIRHNRDTIARLEREQAQAALSGREMDMQIEEKNKQIAQSKKTIEQRKEESAQCAQELERVRRGMNATDQRLAACTDQLAKWNEDLTETRLREGNTAASAAEIQARLTAVEKSLGEKESRRLQAIQAAADYELMLKDTDKQIESLSNAIKGYQMRLNTRRQHVDEAKRQSDQLRLDVEEKLRRARLLEDLEKNLEGFSQSVKLVMKEAEHGRLRGIHGPVSRLFRVPEQVAVAVEIALGPAMQNIVVGDEQDAKRAIGLLKQRDGGRATFLPLSTVRGSLLRENGLEECPGFVGIAAELCQCEETYSGILRSLLGRIAVAEDLDSAVAIARRYSYRFRIVTLDGQVVNAGGSLTGGSINRKSGLLSRTADIERLRKQAQGLQEKADRAVEHVKKAMQEAAEAEASLESAKAELTTIQGERFTIEAETNRVRAEAKSLFEELAALKQEKQSAQNRWSELRSVQEKAEAHAALLTKQMAALQEEMDQISGSRGEQRAAHDALSNALQELRIAVLTAEKDVQSLRASVMEISARKEAHAGRAGELREEIHTFEQKNFQIRQQMETLRAQAEEMRSHAKGSAEKIELLQTKRMELEQHSTELRAKEREKSAEKEAVGHDLARMEERRQNLQKEYDEIISRLWEEYELTRREAEAVGERISNPQQAQRRLNELKNEIRALGTVNVAAVEEYKEVSERYEFLLAQVKDVEQSRNELQRLIQDLTRQMKELFLERFHQIDEHFRNTFRELFGGGSASLHLSDPENVLACGIEIAVQPPGKIVQHLESLSGGEKALVAIALYFAIMKVNPPPFCMLDEIEAALDDVNVTRFAAYLRRMTKNTQFIVITHRRGSMEEADVLYGVTMQDEGISKLLELRASEMEQKLGMHSG